MGPDLQNISRFKLIIVRSTYDSDLGLQRAKVSSRNIVSWFSNTRPISDDLTILQVNRLPKPRVYLVGCFEN